MRLPFAALPAGRAVRRSSGGECIESGGENPPLEVMKEMA